MMNIVKKNLPNGSIPFQMVHDAQVRDSIMKMNENMRLMNIQINKLATAVVELQKKVR